MNTCVAFWDQQQQVQPEAHCFILNPKNGKPGDGKKAWLASQSKYHNNHRQRRRTLLRCVCNSVMKADTDPDVFLSEIFQLGDELCDLDYVGSIERLTVMIVDASPDGKYSTIKLQTIRSPRLSLKQIQLMVKTIFIKSFGKVISYHKESRVES